MAVRGVRVGGAAGDGWVKRVISEVTGISCMVGWTQLSPLSPMGGRGRESVCVCVHACVCVRQSLSARALSKDPDSPL